MTSKFNAKIYVDAGDNTRAIFDSIDADNRHYPENPTATRMHMRKNIEIEIESENLAHLRANLNSTLRLIQACDNVIESVKI